MIRRVLTCVRDSPKLRRRAGAALRCSVFLLSAALFSPAHAESSVQSISGIPVEYLFGLIAALVGLIYNDIKKEIRSLHANGKIRTGHIRHVENAVRKICSHLNIDYRDRETYDE